MMRSAYEVLPDFDSYTVVGLKEGMEIVDQAIEFIIRLSANYTAALLFLREHNVRHKLNDTIVSNEGMDLIGGLLDIRDCMGSELDGAKYGLGQEK